MCRATLPKSPRQCLCLVPTSDTVPLTNASDVSRWGRLSIRRGPVAAKECQHCFQKKLSDLDVAAHEINSGICDAHEGFFAFTRSRDRISWRMRRLSKWNLHNAFLPPKSPRPRRWFERKSSAQKSFARERQQCHHRPQRTRAGTLARNICYWDRAAKNV